MDNKKNTILLTVIAVATLLVAVVGATFAYFTAQGGKSQQTNVTVKTGTGSSSAFTVTDNLSIYADQTTFAQNKTSSAGTSTGEVKWTAPGSTDKYTPSEAERTFCYTVSLEINSNSFKYDEAGSTTGTAQLLFNISRGVGATDGSTGALTEIKTGIDGLTYVSTPVSGMSTTEEGQTATFTGWDITTAASAASKTYQIGGQYKMIAAETTKGAAVQTMTDKWSATVTLINLDANQNYNTGKTLNATLKYDKCA